MKLTKRLLHVLDSREKEQEVSALISPSGRWGMYRDGKGTTLFQVNTGLVVRRNLSHQDARAIVEAYEDISTPLLDDLGFGQRGTSEEARAELVLLLQALNELRHAGKIR